MDSQAIVDTMEVLNTTPLNELLTEAIIKVCYVSDLPNRNGTVINEEVGRQIAASLPGAPVVGFFNEETNDFEEHNRELVFKDNQIEWKSLTRPYGFVSTTVKPWYQDFLEDGILRKYLMCKAYLWTRQYKEASLIQTKGQSMELDESALEGYAEGDVFIFTSAILDKLCILGNAYEPCFEGANITTTYSAFYEDCAKLVEKYTGRRCYVLDGKLNTNYTLDYAVQMGWNIDEAIDAQLSLFSPGSRFSIEGKYMDETGNFCILRSIDDNSFYKITFEITSEDTIKLGSDLIPVKMVWEEKPAVTQNLDPIQEGVEIATESTSNMEPNTVYAAEDTVQKTNLSVPEDEGIVDQSTAVEEKTPEDVKEPLTSDDAEKLAEEQKQEATNEIEASTEAVTDNEENLDDKEDESSEDGADGEKTNESGDDADTETSEASGESAETSFALLNQKVASLEQALKESQSTVKKLEHSLAEYAAKEKENIRMAKENMFAQYSSLLSAAEIEDIKSKVEEYTLDGLEAALAITYARKCQKNIPQQNVQVDVQSFVADTEALPDFMLKAIEFDKKRNLGF